MARLSRGASIAHVEAGLSSRARPRAKQAPADLFAVVGCDHPFKVPKKKRTPQEAVYECALDELERWLRLQSQRPLLRRKAASTWLPQHLTTNH